MTLTIVFRFEKHSDQMLLSKLDLIELTKNRNQWRLDLLPFENRQMFRNELKESIK